jgi:DNA (cytosine-5)-methyltransferase 1
MQCSRIKRKHEALERVLGLQGRLQMKFLELFAGIGGFRLGLEQAGHECVWANEFIPKAGSIYEHNFKHKPDGRDIRGIHVDEIPESDLLVGGFPCATFSVAGRRTGFGTEDTRGTLFFEICRILRSKRIPYVFLENVKGLLNHDEGRTFGVIIASLDELGYDIQWECLNSKNFGVPQNRERVFIVGNLRGHPRPEVFPIGRCFAEDAESSQASQGEGERVRSSYLPTLDAHYYKGGGTRAVIDEGHDSDGHFRATHWRRNHFRDVKGDYTPTPTTNIGAGGNNVPYIVKAVLTPDRKSKRQNGRRIKEQDEPAFTLTSQDRHGVQVGSQLRKLSPMECERLQSLPDNWTRWYADGSEVPDSQRYERCGRAVTVNVIYEIAKRLPL